MKDDYPDLLIEGLDQKELEAYLQAELRAGERDPLNNGYPPSSQQLQFIARGARRRVIVVAANRSGKTTGMMRDVLWTARGQHPYRKVEPHSVIWCGFTDYPSYLRYTKPAFDQWCPPGWMVGDFHESDKFVDIRRVDGGVCRIFFLSYDMPRSKWQGGTVDGIWLDEECPEDIFGECLARIATTRGWLVLTFTPVEGVGYWHDRIWEPALKGQNNWLAVTAALASFDPDNEADFNVGQVLVPHLTREQVIEFASGYPDPDERAIRVFGEVRSRAGLVFKTYAVKIHEIDPFDVPRHWPLWAGLDPGFHGFAAELFTQDEQGTVYRCGEYYSSHEATALRLLGLVAMVKRVREDPVEQDDQPWHPYRMKEQNHEVVEPTVFFVDTEDPQVVMELNIEATKINAPVAFASLDQGLKARKAGILRLQQLLHPDPRRRRPAFVRRPSPPQGEPALYLMVGMASEWRDNERPVHGDRLSWEINRFKWRKTSKSGRNPDDADDASAGGAHALSAFRYAMMARMGPPETPEEEIKADGSTMTEVERMVWNELERIEADMLEGMDEEGTWR